MKKIQIMADYHYQKRIHTISWIMKHSENLFYWGKETKDTSFILYCCYELRNVLEIIELELLYGSVGAYKKRMEILEKAKPKNGTKQVNDELKTLSHKYQVFYECVCEVTGTKGEYFSFANSNAFKKELSNYIHTYTRLEQEMVFGSVFINDAIILIPKVVSFIDKSLMKDENGYTIQNLGRDDMKEEDKILFDEWRLDIVKDKEELKTRIKANIEFRKESNK